MTFPTLQRRTVALAALLLPLAGLLGYVALRSGPLAPVAVTEAEVRSQVLRPALFGIGTVEARQTYRIGPTAAGRLQHLAVDVGDAVRAGQTLGAMDPVDLDERIRAQEAAYKRAEAAVREASARQAFAAAQAQRYAQLEVARSTSEETVQLKRQELAVADAALAAAREEAARVQADTAALRSQRSHLRLLAPADGVVTVRDAEPGSTVLAGQAVLEVVAPHSLWVHLRIDQASAAGLVAGLPAQVHLRSHPGAPLPGRVLRVEPKADAVTEETLAKVVFTQLPTPLPPLGELAEVSVDLPALPATPVVPNAALQRLGAQRGVWRHGPGGLHFTPVTTGRADLEGNVQILQGLEAGDRIIVYSEKALTPRTRVRVESQLVKAQP